MGIYRKVYQPFGGTYFEEMAAQAAAAQAAAAQTVGTTMVREGPQYQLDWPGIAGTAERLGIAANQLATGAQPMDPGAGVLAPGASPEAPPASIQAPPEGTPGVAAASTSPWLLIGGAALVYFVFVK